VRYKLAFVDGMADALAMAEEYPLMENGACATTAVNGELFVALGAKSMKQATADEAKARKNESR
jgi:hypothetical protein